jgi:predicted transposase/invertase (TIGR01784 family)
MSEELICKPSLDIVFKKLFTENPDLLKDFLNLALETDISELTLLDTDEKDFTYLNNELLPDTYSAKLSRLDILLKTTDGEKINVEMQNRDQGNFKERSVYYCSKLFTMDLKSGKNYSEVARTVCINILQFPLFESDNYKSTVFPTIQETGEVITDKWEIIYFETTKLPEEITSRLERWLKFFTVDTEEALFNMERTNDTAIKKAAITVRHLEGDECMREIIRRREDAQFLERSIRYEGYKDGKMQGIQQGMKKGLQKGLQQGLREGTQQANRTTARNMLAGGIPFAEVAKFTGLPLSTIESIHNEL